MPSDNPLQRYFRQPALFLKLPTGNRWYQQGDLDLTGDEEIAVYGLTALDEVLLNTPDAMLNGTALEKVIRNCAPGILNVKKLMLPDLEALFLGIKIATNEGKYDMDRKCPKCEHENTFEVNCQTILDTMTYVEDSDTMINLNDELIIHLRPYTFEMRNLFIQKEFEEERTLRAIDDQNQAIDDFEKSRLLSESVERIASITFRLVAKSISKIVLLRDKVTVTDPDHISEWLVSITKPQADSVIGAVTALNNIGPKKSLPAVCEDCGHSWDEALTFDPINFFGRR